MENGILGLSVIGTGAKQHLRQTGAVRPGAAAPVADHPVCLCLSGSPPVHRPAA